MARWQLRVYVKFVKIPPGEDRVPGRTTDSEVMYPQALKPRRLHCAAVAMMTRYEFCGAWNSEKRNVWTCCLVYAH